MCRQQGLWYMPAAKAELSEKIRLLEQKEKVLEQRAVGQNMYLPKEGL